jgi:hypothetical protein
MILATKINVTPCTTSELELFNSGHTAEEMLYQKFLSETVNAGSYLHILYINGMMLKHRDNFIAHF